MNEEFTNALVNLDTLPLDEADTILSILGGEQRGLIAGDRAITSTGQTVTILGYSSTWKTADLSFSDIPKAEINKKLKKLKISKELSDSDQMAVALFYEKSKKDQQDMMILHPSSLNPMAAYDEDEALRIGRASPINNPKVLTTLVRIMKADATENSLSTSR